MDTPVLPPPPPPPVRPPEGSISVPVSVPSPAPVADPLADLSPQSVLSKHQASTPVPPASTSLDRETLLQQAAQAPESAFILPQVPAAGASLPPPPPVPVAVATSSPLNEDLDDLDLEDDDLEKEIAALTQETGSRSLPPPPPPPVAPVAKVGLPPAAPLSGAKTPPQISMRVGEVSTPSPSRTHPVLIGIGLLLLLLISGGTLYVLASSGTRIPLLYTWVSGLPRSGVQMSQNETTLLASHTSYQQVGDIIIKAAATSSSKPSLPSSDSSTTEVATPVSTLHTQVTLPDPLLYDLHQGSWLGKISLNVDAAASVPAYLQAPASANAQSTWLFGLPANAVAPLVTISQSDLQQMLLYTSLRPVPLPAILSAVQSEKSYDTQQQSGQKDAHYRYVLDTSKITSILPTGAQWKSLEAEVSYTWKTKTVPSALLDGTFTYLGQSYTVQESWSYSNWDKSIGDPSNTDLAQVTDPSSATSAKALSPSDFVAEFGVASFDSIPHGASVGDSTGGSTITPTPTPSPSVSTSPTPTPSTSAAPISPSGQSITATLAPITAAPPLPATPASADADTRDTQRLKDLTDLQNALNRYKADKGAYPTTAALEQTRSSVTLLNALVPTYMTAIPVDPLPDTYWYEYSSDGTTYTLRSVAEDSSNSQAKQGTAYSYFEIDSSN